MKTQENYMLLRFLGEFQALMPTQLPELLCKKTMDEPLVYDDYVQLTFHPTKKLTVAQVADMFEEQAHLKLLYHRVASDGLKGWQCCCAFSNPNHKHMYKFNAEAGDDGIVDDVNVFIFDSIENMRGALQRELRLHRQAGGMIYELGEAELIKMFF